MSGSGTLRRRLGIAALGAALLAGCAPAAASGPRSGAAGGRVVYAVDVQPDCLDPQVSPYDITAAVDRNIFDSLVSMDRDGAFHPWLATAWEISADGREYTFHLREGVTFHDGTPFTAEAVKATLDHTVAPETKSQFAAGLITMYTGATVLDEHTVRIALSRPYTPLLQVLSTATFGIQSPAALREHGGKVCSTPVGTGPFRFASWARNRQIDLDRNPAYAWSAADSATTGPAAVAGLTVQFIPEAAARFGALSSGQVDVAGAVAPSYVSRLQRADGFHFLGAAQPGAVYTLLLNPRRAPLSDERVRTALQRAVRFDDLVRALYSGQYQRAWSVLSPTTPGYSAATEGSWPYDPELAGRLLDEAGWTGRDAEGYRTKDGKRLSIEWIFTAGLMRDQRDTLGQGIQAEARRVGIELRRTAQDAGSYVKNALAHNTDILAFSWTRADPDILRGFFASDQTAERGGSNAFGIAEPRLDDWLNGAAAGGGADRAASDASYAQVQDYVLTHALAIPVYAPATLVGAADRVQGITFDVQAYPRFYGARLEGR